MDFREAINDLPKIDLIATDSPYNIGFKYNEYKVAMNDEEYENMLSEKIMKILMKSLINTKKNGQRWDMENTYLMN